MTSGTPSRPWTMVRFKSRVCVEKGDSIYSASKPLASTETQYAGYRRKNLRIKNTFSACVVVSPSFAARLDGITNPLIAKNSTTPMRPVSTAHARSNNQPPEGALGNCTNTSLACNQMTSNAAIPRCVSIYAKRAPG